MYTATISNITGKLASESTPSGNRVSGMFAVKPTKYESAGKEVTVDSLCNGKVTPDTPTESIKTGMLLDLEPIVESYDASWVAATRNWAGGRSPEDESMDLGESLIASYTDQVCVRPSQDRAVIDFQSNLLDGSSRALGKSSLSLSYQSSNPVQKVKFLLNDKVIRTLRIEKPVTAGDIKTEYSFLEPGLQTLSVVVIDTYGYSSTQSMNISFGGETNAPTITVDSPKSESISLYEGQTANLRFTVVDPVEISAVNLYIDGKLIKILGTSTAEYVVPLGEGLALGKYDIEIRATSVTRQKASRMIHMEILKQ